MYHVVNVTVGDLGTFLEQGSRCIIVYVKTYQIINLPWPGITAG